MTGLCLAAAGLAVTLPLQAFTLAWTHSIEKIRWEEDYRVVERRLQLVEARVRGTGAGMEAPAGATLKDGVWRYRPALPPLEGLHLARSTYVADYELCWDGVCHPMAEVAGPVIADSVLDIRPCPLR